jgi:hypothetical protein
MRFYAFDVKPYSLFLEINLIVLFIEIFILLITTEN